MTERKLPGDERFERRHEDAGFISELWEHHHLWEVNPALPPHVYHAAETFRRRAVQFLGEVMERGWPRCPAKNSASDVQGSVANTSQDGFPEDELLPPPLRLGEEGAP